MSAAPGIFCDHKRLRTSCPECRPPPKPKASAAPRASSKPRQPAEPKEDEPFKRRELRPLPTRPRKKPASRAEAEQADAWWVKK